MRPNDAPPGARAIERRLRALANHRRAELLQRFFKTGPGEYGEGDRFLGLTVPQVRAVAGECGRLPLATIDRLLASRWHEARLLALIALTALSREGDARDGAEIFRFYLARTHRINNWDLVDVSAPQIVGAHLVNRPRLVLYRLARSPHLWTRRIAIIATQALIRRGEFRDTLELARLLSADPHDLIHKAVGWMLREVGKQDSRTLTRFLDRHAGALPRTALRYAIERLPAAARLRYLRMPRSRPPVTPSAKSARRRPRQRPQRRPTSGPGHRANPRPSPG
jgi:3-methyladenine DNA glycosylase AlkD